MRQMGQVAARMLMAYFGGQPLPEEPKVLPTTLIVRSSTAPVTARQSLRPAGDDPAPLTEH
jgi:LacI family transcriptional regulator